LLNFPKGPIPRHKTPGPKTSKPLTLLFGFIGKMCTSLNCW
jgi:hypothetical protein